MAALPDSGKSVYREEAAPNSAGPNRIGSMGGNGGEGRGDCRALNRRLFPFKMTRGLADERELSLSEGEGGLG